MARVHTHYDNLKVARDAPEGVIRAAYRALSQKYHPDKNPNDADAARIMTLVNNAYDVLSDPEKRRLHDHWIEAEEARPNGTAERHDASPDDIERGAAASAKKSQDASLSRAPDSKLAMLQLRRLLAHALTNWFWYLIAGVLVWHWANPEPPPKGPKPYSAEPPSEIRAPAVAPRPLVKAYERPSLAPNNLPWPTEPGYLKGIKQANRNGLSTVTVDNSGNDSDVFVKLVYLDGDIARPVRQFFIPARSSFTVKSLAPGNYDLRHRDLGDGHLSRSDPFEIEEEATEDGRRFTRLTVTLFKVRDGNMKTYPLAEDEFE